MCAVLTFCGAVSVALLPLIFVRCSRLWSCWLPLRWSFFFLLVVCGVLSALFSAFWSFALCVVVAFLPFAFIISALALVFCCCSRLSVWPLKPKIPDHEPKKVFSGCVLV